MKSLFSCSFKRPHFVCFWFFLAFHDDANKYGVVSVLLLTPWYILNKHLSLVWVKTSSSLCLTFSELCCVSKYGQYYAMLCYAVLWWKFGLNPTSQNSLRTKSMLTSCQSNKTHMSQFLSPPTLCTQIPNLFRVEQVFPKACIKLLNEPIFLWCVHEQ